MTSQRKRMYRRVPVENLALVLKFWPMPVLKCPLYFQWKSCVTSYRRESQCCSFSSPGSDSGRWRSGGPVAALLSGASRGEECWIGSRDFECCRVRGRVWLFKKLYMAVESCVDRSDGESLGFGWMFAMAKNSCKKRNL